MYVHVLIYILVNDIFILFCYLIIDVLLIYMVCATALDGDTSKGTIGYIIIRRRPVSVASRPPRRYWGESDEEIPSTWPAAILIQSTVRQQVAVYPGSP